MDGSPSLLRNGRFVRFWIGQSVTYVGDALTIVALPLLAYELTGSASAIGAVMAVGLLPTLASPAIGVLTDRLDRRAVVVAGNVARSAFTFGLFFAGDMLALYALAFLIGVARAFVSPALMASVPSIAAGGDLARANALVQGSLNVALAVGPALGGILVFRAGLGAAFLLDATSFLVSAVLMATVPIPRESGGEEEGGGFWRELTAGFRYLAGARVALGIVAGAFLGVLAANATASADVLLAEEVFDTGERGYGLLISAVGVGMIAGTAALAVLGSRVSPTLLYAATFFVSSAALFGLGVAPAFWLILMASGVMGFSGAVQNVTEETVLQKRVPESLLGRVFSAHFFAFNAGDALGLFLGGLIATAVGVRPTYFLAGTAMFAAALLIVRLVGSSRETN